MSAAAPPPRERRGAPAARRRWYLLLLLPFLGLLWLPFYAHVTPRVFGFPFFYWYQFLWMLIGAAITAIVCRATTDRDGNQRSGGVEGVAIAVFAVLFLAVTVIGSLASRWRQADLAHLREWGLGGRSFGTFVTWFLLGGGFYTAYTFIAVPALVYSVGPQGFFAGVQLPARADRAARLRERDRRAPEGLDGTGEEDYGAVSVPPLDLAPAH